MFTLMDTAGYIAIAIVLFILFIVLWALLTTRRMHRLEMAVRQAEAGVDLALTKRFSVLVKMHETVTATAGVETGRLADAVKWQNGIPPLAAIADKAAYAAEMETLAVELLAVAARHPAFASDRLFADLHAALKITEEQLQNARRLYNATVAAVNQHLSSFPNQIVANALRLEKKAFFDLAEGMNDPDANA